jgi:hypothetical protein
MVFKDFGIRRGLVMKRIYGLVETRELEGYLFKMYDEMDGFLVEVWLDDELINEEVVSCYRINCSLTDEELMALVETNRHDKGFQS